MLGSLRPSERLRGTRCSPVLEAAVYKRTNGPNGVSARIAASAKSSAKFPTGGPRIRGVASRIMAGEETWLAQYDPVEGGANGYQEGQSEPSATETGGDSRHLIRGLCARPGRDTAGASYPCCEPASQSPSRNTAPHQPPRLPQRVLLPHAHALPHALPHASHQPRAAGEGFRESIMGPAVAYSDCLFAGL